jgi:putative membrane protein
MRYTSWDRNDRNAPVLLEEDGPNRLGVFSDELAQLDGANWQLQVEQSRGIEAVDAESSQLKLSVEGNLARASRLLAHVGEREFTLINESGKNWIIDDENGNKVAQFSGANRGVRRAILEFDGEQSLSRDEIIALSFSARMILESRLSSSAGGIIATLLLCTIVAILAFLF